KKSRLFDRTPHTAPSQTSLSSVVSPAQMPPKPAGGSVTAATKFGGGSKCHICGKTAYAVESLEYDKLTFHLACFKCVHCKRSCSLENACSLSKGMLRLRSGRLLTPACVLSCDVTKGDIYCKPC